MANALRLSRFQLSVFLKKMRFFISCLTGSVLSCLYKSNFSCFLLWLERYSRSFSWALPSSINTRMADRAAIEPDRGVKSEVGNRKSEIGRWKSEVGRPSSAFVVLTSVSPKSGIKVKDRFPPSPGRIKFSTIIPDVYIT